MTSLVWVPGRFSLTNKMLSNLRAAGYARGKADAKGWHCPIVDAFAEETRAIRLAVKAAVKREGHDVAPGRVSLTFYVFGHRRSDPSAWYLLGKAAEDGLVDSGMFPSDRFGVWETGGRVLQMAADELLILQRLSLEVPGRLLSAVLGPGLLIRIAEASDG